MGQRSKRTKRRTPGAEQASSTLEETLKKTVSLLTALGVVGAFAAVGPLTAKSGNKYEGTTRTAACPEGGDGSMTIAITGPETLWPPNHKYVDVVVTATDTDGDEVTLATEGTHDQYVEGTEQNGAGNTAEDVSPAASGDVMGTGTASTMHQVRAERAGPDQTGRVYTISYEASGGADDTCMGSFDIFVPHDQRGGAGWKS